MKSKFYKPLTAAVATNLWAVDVADLTGDVTHTITDLVAGLLAPDKIATAERITVQIDWAGLDAADAVFMVKTRVYDGLAFVNEQSDETESNATQVTMVTAAGSHIFHLTPANYQALQLFLDQNSITEGSVSVGVSIKF